MESFIIFAVLVVLTIVICSFRNKEIKKREKQSLPQSDIKPTCQQNIPSKHEEDIRIPVDKTKGKPIEVMAKKKIINDTSIIEKVERYSSWREYKQKHPLRADEIKSLGIDLTSKTDEDASEWLFAIETTAHDSDCKISELKQKYFEAVEKNHPTDADWIYLLDNIVEFSKNESKKYNLKIGNTAGDMILLFVLDKIKEIESKYINVPALTKSDPTTLTMRFMLESHDDVLMLQKMHIYLRKYPMTEQNKQYRDNWHSQMMSIIKQRIIPYENLKLEQPLVYNMAVTTEIFKFVHDEVLDNIPEGLLGEFNNHLLSLHEEMNIISEKATELYTIHS